MPNKIKHILVIRLSAMGDVAMTVPVLRTLTTNYPELKISVLTKAMFKPIFRDLPRTQVIIADVEGKHKGTFGLYKLARELNQQPYYAIADLHNVLRSKVLKKFIRCRMFASIDKGRKEKRQLISGNLFHQLKSTTQRYADVFETLGYEIDLSNPTFPERSTLSKNILKLTDNKHITWIGIAPFATFNGKMYPLDLMKSVIFQLAKTHKILLFGGGEKEIEILNALESEFNNVLNLAGKFTFDEELDIISNLDVMLSMDSGNAHLAANFGVKVVTIWGVTHPFAGFAPFNQPKDYALLANRNDFPLIPTSVYGNKYPESYKEASRSISPEHVVEKINAIL